MISFAGRAPLRRRASVAIAKEDHRRDAPDVEPRRDGWERLGEIDLRDDDFPRALTGDLRHLGRDGAAGPAPRRPEVHEDWPGAPAPRISSVELFDAGDRDRVG